MKVTLTDHVASTLRHIAEQLEEGNIICYSWCLRNEADDYTGEVLESILKAKFVYGPDYMSEDEYDDGDAIIEKLNELLKNKEVEVNGD